MKMRNTSIAQFGYPDVAPVKASTYGHLAMMVTANRRHCLP